MNNLNLAKTLFRLSGYFSHIVRHKHQTASRVLKLSHETQVPLKNVNISSLIQRTIIPLNIHQPKPSILDQPCLNIIRQIDSPLSKKIDIFPIKEIEDPVNLNIEKKAHRMLRIRKRKMKKHIRRKFRKRMTFIFAKIRRQRKEKKENIFRNEILTKLKEAKRFHADQYVKEKLELFRMEILPNRIPGGVKMPESVVKEVYEKKESIKKMLNERRIRREKMIAERGSLNVEPDSRFD